VTPLPGPLGGKELVAWRIDRQAHSATWDSGEGAFQVGGRWNSRGVRAVYCSIDPATAIVEVAVHKGFAVLDAVPHVLTRFEIKDPNDVHIVDPRAVANPNWPVPGAPGAGQQAFGDALLATHKFVLIPSTVSKQSWNLVFVATRASDAYRKVEQERLAIDTRLNPPTKR
jgi:RES domain-containing protein